MADSQEQKEDFWHHLQSPDADEEQPKDGLSREEKIEFYSVNADTYDEAQEKVNLRGPKVLAEAMHRHLQGKTDAKILDVASGTGEVMKQLRMFAPYNNADGLDAARGMLDVAEKRGVYKKTYHIMFTVNTGIERNSYDVVCCSGAIGPGHIKSEGMQEMLDIAKPGGYVMVVIRTIYTKEYPQYMDMLPMIHRWQDEGKITIEEESTFENYYEGFDGITLILKKL